MSVINQVLDQLEQRGAHTPASHSMVRVVHRYRRNLTMPLLATGLALLAGIAAWQWMPLRNSAAAAVSIAPKTVSPPPPSEPEKLMPQKQVAATATAPAPGGLAGAPPEEPPAPASRLSFELSSIPISSLRQDSEQATSTGSGQALRKSSNSKPAANPATSGKHGTGKQVSPPDQKPASKARTTTQAAAGAVPMKQVSSAQRADAEFRRAAALMQQGQIADAITGYEAALRLDAGHEAARQALVALLLEGKRNADAEKVLLEGLNNKPEQTGFTMLLARLQVERGALEQAIATLEKSLPFAETQADYRAFLAAVLQRQNRNKEAVSHYQIALQHAPGNGVWLMGYGISLQALQRNAEAKDAFKRALDTQTLNPELQAFVLKKIKEL